MNPNTTSPALKNSFSASNQFKPLRPKNSIAPFKVPSFVAGSSKSSTAYDKGKTSTSGANPEKDCSKSLSCFWTANWSVFVDVCVLLDIEHSSKAKASAQKAQDMGRGRVCDATRRNFDPGFRERSRVSIPSISHEGGALTSPPTLAWVRGNGIAFLCTQAMLRALEGRKSKSIVPSLGRKCQLSRGSLWSLRTKWNTASRRMHRMTTRSCL